MPNITPAVKNEPQTNESDPTNKSADELARSIAEEFGDLDNLPTYQMHCRKYPEQIVRKAHEHTLSVPPDKVKRSRLALFIYLVKKYARDSK
ncbi:MAG: hypothetical protein RBT76_07630 [candidate division Zixibacteria bacterium]|jgi:hypothetical protein|nr:hypothetical protein [candidate division Zixibacteria bacterium]